MSWTKAPLTTTLKPAPPKKQPHEHKWVYQDSDYKFERGAYNHSYTKIDTYYCENCLEIKDIIAKHEDCRDKPYWFKG
jgi:hypothetical protein